jgi:hypothetical protein
MPSSRFLGSCPPGVDDCVQDPLLLFLSVGSLRSIEPQVAQLILLFVAKQFGNLFHVKRGDTYSKTGLHPPFVRESFLMRKVVAQAAGLILPGLIISLVACQSGGTSSKSAQMTDPNAVFSQGGAQKNAANGTTSGVSSRRGRGLFRGPGAGSEGP